jgi:hypothetical protein
MKKIFLTVTITFCLLVFTNAQDYKTGIGLRAGPYIGFTVKQFLNEKSAIEALVSTRWKGIEFTGLYEIHFSAFKVDRLNWFLGGGGHIGFYNGDNTDWGTAETSYINAGIDGIIGLEYSFSEFPVSLSIDWKPALNLTGDTGFWVDNAALSIRYIF